MKRSVFFLGLLLCGFSQIHGAGVTYHFSGGRFGDNLVAYLHAKWLSFAYGVPLVYRPFRYSDQLKMHRLESRLPKDKKYIRKILRKESFKIDIESPSLYAVPYFSEYLHEHQLGCNKHWIYFNVDWDDRAFHEQMCQMLSPIDKSLMDFEVPSDCPTIALHIRVGKIFDGPGLTEKQPLKAPPLEFYTQQLEYLLKEIDAPHFYAHIFTDDPEPAELAKKILAGLEDSSRIELDYRKEVNRHDLNVLKDFYALTKFDYMIHPLSSFSTVAAKIGRPLIEIMPKKSETIVEILEQEKLKKGTKEATQKVMAAPEVLAKSLAGKRRFNASYRPRGRKLPKTRHIKAVKKSKPEKQVKTKKKIVISEVEIIKRERW